MGVGGHFWDLLKPLSIRRVRLFEKQTGRRGPSYWIVQHETAIKSYTMKPHIRLTFFRTVKFSPRLVNFGQQIQFGAYPVFVLDGTPSPLKSQARILRFLRSSGIDLSSLPEAEEGVSVERNMSFRKCVEECVELLELLGMAVLKAKGEAEALCAHVNREGYVDACITCDSDVFPYGAKCVIKRFQPNSKEPFEYNIFGWRLQMGRLPTMEELAKRRIPISSPYCVLCDSNVETIDHLFTGCNITNSVWQSLSKWCNIPNIYAFSINDILETHEHLRANHTKKEVIKGLIVITCWSVWKARNSKLHSSKEAKVEDILEEIRYLGFLWYKNRPKPKTISWEDWRKFEIM